ncbi:MAG TPA: 6-phosphogluconolactonase [Pyrinomonadaceae bacterium]|jgi:6-phosphogluconolactonase|nr:6-phosphogluconolactonase [Pyrinomonadaceae bacterium]
MSDGRARVLIFDDAEGAARAAAGRFAEIAGESVRARGRFSVALSGGSTPRRIYELLAGEEFGARVDWSKAHVFFGDERCVPPDDAASNYRMAQDALLSRVSVPAENVHRMIGEGDAASNARLYEEELRAFFGDAASPAFDLVMLGMGEDGHTASLFPETPALDERGAWVVANRVEKLGAYRLTLTATVINHAAHVLFVATGAGKAVRLSEVLSGAREPHRLPAQLIRPTGGTLEWYVDRAAASKLEGGVK